MNEPPLPRGRRRRLLVGLVVFGLLLVAPPALGVGVLLAATAWHLGHRVAGGQRSVHRTARAGRAAAELETGGTILGVSPSGATVVIPDRALAAHGLILGASGSGKSTTMLTLLAGQLQRGRSVVAIDLKGSPTFARELNDAAAGAGVRFRLWTPDGPAHWNPLAAGNATELKDKLIATERFTEPHYQRAAERYLQTAIQVLHERAPDSPVSLAAVVELLEPDRLAAALRPLPAARGDHIRDYLSSLTHDQLSAIRGLGTRLAVLSESHTGPYLEPRAGAGSLSLSGGDIDLRRTLGGGGGGEVVLFSLNSSTYGRLAAQLGTLVVQDLVTAAGARLSGGERGLPPAVVAIDEFSALGSDNVLSLLARGREAGIGVLLATQELADLDRAARGLRDQVLGNTAVKIAHRQDVPESAAAVARLGGSYRDWERSYQQAVGPLSGTGQRRENLRLVDRYAIEPDRIRTLGTGEAAVILKAPRAQTILARVTRPASGWRCGASRGDGR